MTAHPRKAAAALIGLVLATAAAAVAAPFTTPFPPFTYLGTVSAYDGTPFTAADDVEIRALHPNGACLAACEVSTDLSPNYNFILAIPMASLPSDSAAVSGDSLDCQIYRNGRLYLNPAMASLPPVGSAAGITNLHLVLSSDTDTNGIPDEYESEILARLFASGIAATDYDPAGDLDGDRVSNAAEYFAGTDPLDATDFLHISAFAPDESIEGGQTIRFLASPSRTYLLQNNPSILDTNSPSWSAIAFRTDSNAVTTVSAIRASAAPEQAETLTLYFIPAPENATGFYRLSIAP